MSLATPTQSPRPGTRIDRYGKEVVFDMDALNAHLARERIASAPADLSGLSADDLTGLRYAALRLPHEPGSDELLQRAIMEERRRACPVTMRGARAA